MKILKIEILQTHMPFRFSYGHARATHRWVDAVLCRIQGEGDLVGYGEAVPRDYVTGESCNSVLNAITSLCRPFLHREFTLQQFKADLMQLAAGFPLAFPSCAFCAFEGAVLELFSKQAGLPLAHLFAREGKNPLVYSGSIGLSRNPSWAKALGYKALGFRHFKIKVGQDIDAGQIAAIRKLYGPGCQFFADANCAWKREDAIKKIEELHRQGIWAIEEPLKPREPVGSAAGQKLREAILDERHYADYAWLKARSPLPLIADESLISPGSFQKILDFAAFDLFNIRLSKCGGFLSASRMIEELSTRNLPFGIGAMVAESPILANEGSHFGYVHAGHRYIQGYSHKVLHRYSFTSDIKFPHGGAQLRLDLTAPGLGLKVDRRKLARITVKEVVLQA